MWTVYAYVKCSTCRRALQFLEAAGQPHQVVPIREKPPQRAELQRALESAGGNVRRLFNTSGTDYREQKVGEMLDHLSAGEALALLASNGNLVKRPFVVSEAFVLVGFDEAAWGKRLPKKRKKK